MSGLIPAVRKKARRRKAGHDLRAASSALSARERLAIPSGRRVYPGIGTWMRENAAAVELAEAWLEMRADGTTDWSMSRLLRELVSEYGLPYKCQTALGRWLFETYGDAYKRANARS